MLNFKVLMAAAGGVQKVLDGIGLSRSFGGPSARHPAAGPEPLPTLMSDPHSESSDYIHSDEFLNELMKRQLRVSIACAAAFLLLLLGLPLLNYFAPELMAKRVGGFTLSWLLLGVLFFPYVWIIARWFIKRSIQLEQAEVKLAQQKNQKSA